VPPIAALAARWTEAFGRGPGEFADLYAADVAFGDLAGPDALRHGRDERVAADRALYTRLPDRAVEVLRLLELDGRQAVLECLVSGTSSSDPYRMAVPALLWWWVDGEGRVARELAWFRWQDRRPDSARPAGTLTSPQPPRPPLPEPEADDQPRSRSWYQAYATHLAETWSWDPVLADRSLYDDGCVVESATSPGRALHGLAALEAADAELAELLPRPHRRLVALDVLGEGRALAIRVALEGRAAGRGPLQRAHGALVLALDSSDRVASSRSYLDWASAEAAITD
jgi:hypothetical protein